MLKIRLMRIGAKKRPFYRVVVVDERAKRTGGYIELLGTYNPLTEPKDIKLKQDRIDYWVKQGAQASDGFLRITGKAPQRPPRKPKKEVGAKKPEESTQIPEETKAVEESTKSKAAEVEDKKEGDVTAIAAEEPQNSQSEETSQPEPKQNDKQEEDQTETSDTSKPAEKS